MAGFKDLGIVSKAGLLNELNDSAGDFILFRLRKVFRRVRSRGARARREALVVDCWGLLLDMPNENLGLSSEICAGEWSLRARSRLSCFLSGSAKLADLRPGPSSFSLSSLNRSSFDFLSWAWMRERFRG